MANSPRAMMARNICRVPRRDRMITVDHTLPVPDIESQLEADCAFSFMAFDLKRYRTLLALWLVSMAALNAFVFVRSWSRAVGGSPDFRIFYTAGLIFSREQGYELYDNNLQWQTQREFVQDSAKKAAFLPYNHPPFEALLFIPLAHL